MNLFILVSIKIQGKHFFYLFLFSDSDSKDKDDESSGLNSIKEDQEEISSKSAKSESKGVTWPIPGFNFKAPNQYEICINYFIGMQREKYNL